MAKSDVAASAVRPVRPFSYDPPLEPLKVLFADRDLLVVDKASGLLSVPGKRAEHADCLESRAQEMFGDARIVHRLDMDTSGVMVLARNRAAHRHLGLQFERRHVAKTYLAKVWGIVAQDKGEIDLPLICDWPNRPRQMVDFERGKKALTKWQVLARGAQTTLLELKPQTGRSHQLRVHMLSMGHPVLGDNLYASGAALTAAPRLMLHAHRLAFYHPDGGMRLSFTAACDFTDLT